MPFLLRCYRRMEAPGALALGNLFHSSTNGGKHPSRNNGFVLKAISALSYCDGPGTVGTQEWRDTEESWCSLLHLSTEARSPLPPRWRPFFISRLLHDLWFHSPPQWNLRLPGFHVSLSHRYPFGRGKWFWRMSGGGHVLFCLHGGSSLGTRGDIRGHTVSISPRVAVGHPPHAHLVLNTDCLINRAEYVHRLHLGDCPVVCFFTQMTTRQASPWVLLC